MTAIPADIEYVNDKAKEMRDATGVYPDMALVAREIARELRKEREAHRETDKRAESLYERNVRLGG